MEVNLKTKFSIKDKAWVMLPNNKPCKVEIVSIFVYFNDIHINDINNKIERTDEINTFIRYSTFPHVNRHGVSERELYSSRQELINAKKKLST